MPPDREHPTRWAILVTLTLLAITISAEAHVPVVGESAGSFDGSRSWALFEEVAPGEEDVWTFRLARGDPLFLVLGTPVRADWTPRATLEGPDGPIELRRIDEISFEPFTPYASRDAWALDVVAPADGDYVLRVGGQGGAYVLGFGLRESFTPAEWAAIPWQALRVHAWEGQPTWWLALPYLLALSIALVHGLARGPSPQTLPRIAAALMLGTGVERGGQILLAVAEGARGPGGAFAIAIILAAISVALAWATWRARRPLTLAIVALVGVVAWAGLLLGPALALVAAGARASRSKPPVRPVEPHERA